MPYIPTGTNASIVVGLSPDLKVIKILKDYNMTERNRKIDAGHNRTHDLRRLLRIGLIRSRLITIKTDL